MKELSDLLGCEPSEILRLSAKTGLGVESVLDAVIERIPPPTPIALDKAEPLQALVFDSYYDSFRGVVSLCSVFQGEVKKGECRLRCPFTSYPETLTPAYRCRRFDHLDHERQFLHRSRPRDPFPSRGLDSR